MKYLHTSYVFDASAQTVQFLGYASGTLDKEGIILITNVEDGIIIYNFADSSKGGTITPDAGGDILTLEHDTTSMDDADLLQIWYDDGAYPATYDLTDQIRVNTEATTNAITNQLPATLGQKDMANSLAVVFASDQDSLDVSGSVGVSSLPSIPAGTNNIGDVDIASIAAGDNNIGNVDVVTLPSIPAGTNNIGDVDVLSLPAIPAGTNNIGDVDVLTVPADPFGANADAASATGSISAKLRFIASTGIPVTGTVTVGSHAVTNAGTFATQIDGAALTALQLIDDTVFADDAAFTPGTSKVNAIGLQADETATDSVDEGDIGAPRMTLNRLQITVNYAHTTGGWTPGRILSANTTNATSVKGSAGQLGFIHAINLNAAVRYLKIYNKASSPTVGTDTPVLTFPIPASTTGAGFILQPTPGIDLTTGIAMALTTGIADADTGAVAANEIIINYGYK